LPVTIAATLLLASQMALGQAVQNGLCQRPMAKDAEKITNQARKGCAETANKHSINEDKAVRSGANPQVVNAPAVNQANNPSPGSGIDGFLAQNCLFIVVDYFIIGGFILAIWILRRRASKGAPRRR
jgi:hypothetical protein